jgi:hypothetical protein
LRAAFFLELFFRELFARPDVRFLAVRPFLAALRFGAFAFLPRAEVFRDFAAAFFFALRGRLALGAAGGGVGV